MFWNIAEQSWWNPKAYSASRTTQSGIMQSRHPEFKDVFTSRPWSWVFWSEAFLMYVVSMSYRSRITQQPHDVNEETMSWSAVHFQAPFKFDFGNGLLHAEQNISRQEYFLTLAIDKADWISPALEVWIVRVDQEEIRMVWCAHRLRTSILLLRAQQQNWSIGQAANLRLLHYQKFDSLHAPAQCNHLWHISASTLAHTRPLPVGTCSAVLVYNE